jgi:hypothetical protein
MARQAPYLFVAAVIGCHWPGHESFTSYQPEEMGSTSGAPESSTTSTLPTTTADTWPSSTGTTVPSFDLGDGTTSEPIAPPAIVEPSVMPDPLTELGAVAVSVVTANASGVRMQVDDGDTIELAGGPDVYSGGIPFYTGLSSGPHSAKLVAWRDELESEPVVVPFEVALPEPGEAYLWQTPTLYGMASVAAVAALPPGDGDAVMVEWGTFYENNQPRCYLRRRDAEGVWGPADYVEVLPDSTCVATDLEVAPDGTLHLLATRSTPNGLRWWLGRVTAWEAAANPEYVSEGGSGDEANALARSADTVAVCGTRPVNSPDPDTLDAAVWVVGEPVRLFDYPPPDLFPHSLDERLRGCAFDGTTLVAVGDAYGKHTLVDPNSRHRHLQLRLDLDSNTLTPHVGAELGSATQSMATGVTIVEGGRVVTVGHVCGDTCDPEAQVWVHDAEGVLEWYAPLGSGVGMPRAIAASPAGYVVLAGSRLTGQGSRFWMAAYFIGQYDPAWTFVSGGDMTDLQMANTASVSAAGHVYGGGVGEGGFPAIAYIHP